ncbi:universal stress protein [Granulicella sp. dw_53]|uniref:universal stress protein n=1 Tax=Granulicella sp. dw_53 TaxID=2719792 RepID=UPI001BD4CBDC|nr:universal stress protein [Granulicella sp. dw_53]
MPVIGDYLALAVEKILFATDFSVSSEKAAAYARALAHRFASTVEIVHVFDPSVVSTYEEAIIGLPLNERRRMSAERLERLRGDFFSVGVTARATLPEGHRPSVRLLEVANENKVDLIVAGMHSKPEVERMVLGSTAERLIRNAQCPVLTIGPNARPPKADPLCFQTILFATDFSPQAAKAAIYALSFAEDSGAKIYFCHVRGVSAHPDANQSLYERFESDLKRMIPERSYDWCNPECVVEQGDAAEAILGLAERTQADLIVMGARKASFWLTHIKRGLTLDLLAEATCPILTVS